MNIIRNFFSSIISFFLVISLTALIFLASFNKIIFDPQIILGTLKTNDTYSKVTTEFLPQLLITGILSSQPGGQADLRDKIVEKLDKNSFSTFSVELEKIVESSYDYVIGKNNGFSLTINATKYIPNIRADLEKVINELKTEGYFQGEETSELINSFEESGELTLVVTEKSVEVSGTKLPDATEKTAVQNQEKPPLQELRTVLETSKLAEQSLLVGSIFLALLLLITRIPHYSSGLRWLGGALFSSALLPLIASIILLFAKPIDLIIKFLKEQETFTYAQGSVELVGKNLTVYLESFLVNLRFYSIAVVIVAAIFFSAAILIPHVFKHRKVLDSKIVKDS